MRKKAKSTINCVFIFNYSKDLIFLIFFSVCLYVNYKYIFKLQFNSKDFEELKGKLNFFMCQLLQ